jgi:2-oxoglutarate dehydrogenase E2 component (dihydrolipoamide succinyltransferase)
LPFIIRVVIDGLKQHPVLNAAVSGANIIYRKQYNIGIAVALDWGLIVPVIKGADDLSLSGLTRSLNDLADRARTKRLKPEEVQGATFTITNPGVFGSLMGTPIIPLGTSAILGLGAIEKRPKVVTGPDGEETIAIRTCAYFSLSFDHRIVDGADADKFLATLKKTLESFPDAAV